VILRQAQDELVALIFDLDGTLIDSREDIADAANFALEKLGVPAVPSPSVWRHIGGGIRSLLGGILKTEDAAVIKRAVECFREYYSAHCLDKTVLYPGVTEVLAYYDGRKKRMAVVTNKDQEFTHKILAGLGVEKYFQSRIGAREGDRKKPHPDLLHRALEELKSDPAQTVIIGDSPADIEAGQKAGTKTCGVGYGIGEPEKVRKAKPDFWVETPSELIKLF